MSNVRDLIEAYGSWVEEKVEEGWDVYILTFVFHPLPGSPATMKAIMQREVERVYATLLTRVVRYPNSPGSAGKLPIWIVLPDYPVPKHDKKSLREVTLNDGLHLHALGLIPPNSRLRQRLDHHFQDNRALYLPCGQRLAMVHARPITRDHDSVVDYALKALKRGRVSLDDVLVLPRSVTEISRLDPERMSAESGTRPRWGQVRGLLPRAGSPDPLAGDNYLGK